MSFIRCCWESTTLIWWVSIGCLFRSTIFASTIDTFVVWFFMSFPCFVLLAYNYQILTLCDHSALSECRCSKLIFSIHKVIMIMSTVFVVIVPDIGRFEFVVCVHVNVLWIWFAIGSRFLIKQANRASFGLDLFTRQFTNENISNYFSCTSTHLFLCVIHIYFSHS